MSENKMAYRATCPHGQVVMITADSSDMREYNAIEIANCIHSGLTIDRVTCQEARLSNFGCDSCRTED